MRIAIFSDTFLPQINGVTKTLSRMKDYMDKNAIDYKFMIPGEQTTNNYFEQTISFQSYSFFLYPGCKVSFPHYQRVKEAMDGFRPDIIHLVTPFSLGLMGMKYARDNDIPIVSSYHTNFPQYLKHYNLQFLEPALWHFFRWFHSYSHINFCPSMDTLVLLKGKGIQDLEIWGRGIDVSRFSPDNRSEKIRSEYTDGREVILLYVGRLAPEKELDVLMAAADIMNKKGLKFRLVIVGDGPSRQSLEALDIPNVTFAGYKSGGELQEIYASADLFAFPSSTETYGNVILEAMASGLPVVAAGAGGVKENLVSMYNGIAFEPGSETDMASAMEVLISNENLRTRLGRNARTHSLSRNWDSVFAGLLRRYDEIINIWRHNRRNLPA